MSGAFVGRNGDGLQFGGDGWDRGRYLNWGACFVLILALHIGVLWAALHWASWLRSVPPPIPAAMMIDLAPLPAAPPVPPTQAAAGPRQTISQPPPVPQVQLPLPPPPPSPAPKIEVPVPPRMKLKPLHHKQPVVHPAFLPQTPNQKQPAPATTAPPQLTAPIAPAEAPVPGVSPENSANTVASWQSLLLGRLEQFKRYPEEAQMDGEEGTAYLHFTMDRHGKVLSANIAASSGYAVLDQETLALVYRAEPLPPPPPSIPDDPIELTVPVQFFLHQ